MSEKTLRAVEESIIDEPLVSIVIPVYNVSCYLPQCLDSVVSQTYRRLEIILVDDGSTDDSGSICDQYAKRDNRIQVIHSENRGLATARNIALEKVRGEYISFLDSDDWAEPQLIEILLRAVLLTGSDIVSARYCLEYVGKTVHPSAAKEHSHTYRGEDILSAFAECRFGNMVWNKIYRAECFKEIRFPDGQNYEDVSIVWKLMMIPAKNDGAVTALSDELFHYRVRVSSISHTWTVDNVIDSWRAYRAKYEILSDHQEKLLAECFTQIMRMWVSFCSYSKEDKAKARKTVREMHSFSKKNFYRVIIGNYSKLTKSICLLSQSRSAPAMWIAYCGGKLRNTLKKGKYKMYD